MEKVRYLLNPELITYTSTYSAECKVPELVNSQYLNVVNNGYQLIVPFKYCYFVNGKIVLTFNQDQKVNVWNKEKEQREDLTLKELVKIFDLEIIKYRK